MKCSDVNPTDGTASVTSSTLLRTARAHDAGAWEQLVRTYSRRMYRWCRLAGLQPADAANVVQEAFVSVARKLADFRRDRPGATFRGWLRRIVDNKIRDHYRQFGRRLDVAAGGTDAQRRLADAIQGVDCQAPGDTGCVNEVNADQTELTNLIAQVRHEVGERDWRMFWRVVVDGQSAPDVGEEFDVTANAVRLVKMRVLRRLRGYLNGQSPRPKNE